MSVNNIYIKSIQVKKKVPRFSHCEKLTTWDMFPQRRNWQLDTYRNLDKSTSFIHSKGTCHYHPGTLFFFIWMNAYSLDTIMNSIYGYWNNKQKVLKTGHWDLLETEAFRHTTTVYLGLNRTRPHFNSVYTI